MEEQETKLSKEELRKQEIAESRELLAKIKEESKSLDEKIAKAEELKAEMMVSGESDAGQTPPPPETDEDRITRECNEFLKSTGLKV